MKTVLDALLEQHGLAYVVKNEMLYITCQRRAKGDLFVKMHYVGDINNAGDLLEIVQTVIQPESWMRMELGGEGEIQVHPSTESLAVRQTEEVHTQIEDLLTQIRELNTHRAAAPEAVVR